MATLKEKNWKLWKTRQLTKKYICEEGESKYSRKSEKEGGWKGGEEKREVVQLE